MIEARQLKFCYGQQCLFANLNFTIRQGEIVSILGPNGCGKSTLLRLLRGNLQPDAGEILWNQQPVSRISAKMMATRVAVVPQSTHIDFPYRVREMVAMGRYPHRKSLLELSSKKDQEAVRHALVVTDILDLADRPVTQLSGGELQRVLFARALAQQAEVLFLDEATSHLDIDHRLELSELLVRLNREQGTTIVQISHDLDLASAVSDRILLLSGLGKIAGFDTPQQVMTPVNLRRVFRVEVNVEENPLTGAPQIIPLINTSGLHLDGLRVHLFCGGGSGKSLLRKLQFAGARVSTGPLNRGDSDEEVAAALNTSVIREDPFQPFSQRALDDTRQALADADVIVVATVWWGRGNCHCLDLAAAALADGKEVFLLNPAEEHDFTEGQAWADIQTLLNGGAHAAASEDQLLGKLGLLTKQIQL